MKARCMLCERKTVDVDGLWIFVPPKAKNYKEQKYLCNECYKIIKKKNQLTKKEREDLCFELASLKKDRNFDSWLDRTRHIINYYKDKNKVLKIGIGITKK